MCMCRRLPCLTNFILFPLLMWLYLFVFSVGKKLWIYKKGTNKLCFDSGFWIIEAMRHFSSMFDGLARSFSMRRGKKNSSNGDGREAAETMAKDAKKHDMILRSSGFVSVDGSNNLASVCSKRGRKGVNQDCAIVWEVRPLP